MVININSSMAIVQQCSERVSCTCIITCINCNPNHNHHSLFNLSLFFFPNREHLTKVANTIQPNPLPLTDTFPFSPPSSIYLSVALSIFNYKPLSYLIYIYIISKNTACFPLVKKASKVYIILQPFIYQKVSSYIYNNI